MAPSTLAVTFQHPTRRARPGAPRTSGKTLDLARGCGGPDDGHPWWVADCRVRSRTHDIDTMRRPTPTSHGAGTGPTIEPNAHPDRRRATSWWRMDHRLRCTGSERLRRGLPDRCGHRRANTSWTLPEPPRLDDWIFQWATDRRHVLSSHGQFEQTTGTLGTPTDAGRTLTLIPAVCLRTMAGVDRCSSANGRQIAVGGGMFAGDPDDAAFTSLALDRRRPGVLGNTLPSWSPDGTQLGGCWLPAMRSRPTAGF